MEGRGCNVLPSPHTEHQLSYSEGHDLSRANCFLSVSDWHIESQHHWHTQASDNAKDNADWHHGAQLVPVPNELDMVGRCSHIDGSVILNTEIGKKTVLARKEIAKLIP